MRKPQRNFLIEYKSGRRQTKPRANSIWGETDLSAIARELEDESHPVFTAGPPLDSANARGDIEPVNANEAEDLNRGTSATLPPESTTFDNAVETKQNAPSEASPGLSTTANHIRKAANQSADV
jgi:hypothetical protein